MDEDIPEEEKKTSKEKLNERGAKFNYILEAMNDLWKSDKTKKVIIFSQYPEMIKHICKCLTQEKIPFCRFDGASSPAKRAEYLNEFKQNPKMKVVVMSTKLGLKKMNQLKDFFF